MPEGPAVAGFEALGDGADPVDRSDHVAERDRAVRAHQGGVAPPRVANGKAKPAWRKLPGKVTHVFTHFPLELVVYAAAVPAGTRAPAGMRFVRRAGFDDEAWPSLMRKVIELARMG